MSFSIIDPKDKQKVTTFVDHNADGQWLLKHRGTVKIEGNTFKVFKKNGQWHLGEKIN